MPKAFSLTEDEVAPILSRYLRTTVGTVRRLPGFVGNEDFMLETGAGDFVLKAGAAGGLFAEAAACERVRAAGVSAPEIVGVERELLPMPFLLMRRIPGGPPESATDPVFREAGRQLRLTHSLPAQGFGYLTENSVGPYQRWAEFTAEPLSTLEEMVDNQLLGSDVADRLRSCVDKYRDAVAYEGPPVLLHGDLHPRHVFTNGGRLTGIIDWGDVAAGDPRLDLARFTKGGADSLPTLLEGYGIALTPELSITMTVYRLLWTTLVLREEFRAGGDWFDAYRTAIACDIALLEHPS